MTAWVATMEDSTAINTDYSTFTVTLYDGQQNEITTGSIPTMSSANHKGSMTIPYDFVANNGYKINGFVSAS